MKPVQRNLSHGAFRSWLGSQFTSSYLKMMSHFQIANINLRHLLGIFVMLIPVKHLIS